MKYKRWGEVGISLIEMTLLLSLITLASLPALIKFAEAVQCRSCVNTAFMVKRGFVEEGHDPEVENNYDLWLSTCIKRNDFRNYVCNSSKNWSDPP
ncbi:MAG: hypothetical protein GYA55_02735 [SAR324 cluster bacterium]|uniref:Uncharacterized protein n=1 Tax=SAR324 cluster bacterium TaxID=2024889 RepID=A0A7X9FQ01_9DELT|nr:hypothetical protein [SAR324 cluster bacterium]